MGLPVLCPGVNCEEAQTDKLGVLPSQVKDLFYYWFKFCFNVDLLVMADMLFLSACKPLMLVHLCSNRVNFRVEMDFSRPMNIWSTSCIMPSLLCCLWCKIYACSKSTVTMWCCVLDEAAMGVWISCFQLGKEHTT